MIPQTRAQWLNLGTFCTVVLVQVIVLSLAAALASDTMTGFREGELFRPGRDTAIGLLTLLTPIIGGWVIQNRPRFGSEALAAQVNDLRADGYHRDQLTVVPKDGAQPTTSQADATIAALDLDCPIMHLGHRALTALVPASGHEVLSRLEARHLDGSAIVGDEVRCDTCGAVLVGVEPVGGTWVAQAETTIGNPPFTQGGLTP